MARRKRRWHRSPWAEPLLAWLVAAYIRLVHATGRWQLRCDPEAARLIRERRPLIAAFWHGRMLMMAVTWWRVVRHVAVAEPRQAYVLSSDHRDGRFMARATAHFRLETTFGSTKRGAGDLLKKARAILRGGDVVVITPDGPRGPRMRAKPGAVHLAMITGAPIVPVTFAAANQRLFESWDRFALPLPFARGVMAVGSPLEIARDDDVETARMRLESALNGLTAEADRAVGRAPVEPAA